MKPHPLAPLHCDGEGEQRTDMREKEGDMPERNSYTTAQKTAAMTVLERNGGNIQLTAQQTGIPYRTIYDWQRDMLPMLEQYAPASARPPTEMPTFENDLDALAFIRQNILGELSRLSASLQYDSGFSTPYQRALVLSQLMDKLLKLRHHNY